MCFYTNPRIQQKSISLSRPTTVNVNFWFVINTIYQVYFLNRLVDGSPALLVRDKREPSRSMTFSSFMPGSGLSAFASSGDFPYYRPRGRWGGAEREEPSTVEQPPERGSGKPWGQPQAPEAESGVESADEPDDAEEESSRPTKKNKKKYSPKEEDEEEYEKPSRSGK